MRNPCSALLALLAAVLCAEVGSAQTTTVILSDNQESTFHVKWTDVVVNGNLQFPFDRAALPENAQVTRCELLVVVVRPTGRITGQDVAVNREGLKIGELNLSGEDASFSYRRPLKPSYCDPSLQRLVLTLESKTPNTDWTYYGGTADTVANRPRLIVTYDSPSRPTPSRSGQSIDWTYAEPAAFFSSRLWEGEMLANPVSYNGAAYLVAACPAAAGRCLYRVAGVGNVANWPLVFGNEKESFDLITGSFAFVTAWGRLQIITKDAIHSCDLTTLAALRSEEKMVCPTTPKSENITVKADETPAMGSDGSLYFKNVVAGGSIVARNPSLKEIWSTDFKLTDVSPMSLSANGRYAFVLTNLSPQSNVAARMIALLRLDTASGATVSHEISYKDEKNKEVKPLLQTLLRPAVASKVIGGDTVDYVFVAGNTSDTGVVQLIAFEPCVMPSKTCPIMKWSRQGTVAAAPVLSVDGNSLFVAWQDETGQNKKLQITRYDWYNTTEKTTGAYGQSDLPSTSLGSVPGSASSIVVDGNNSLYVLSSDQSLYVYPGASNRFSKGQQLPFNPKLLQFATDGALIGYNDMAIYDLSPKAAPKPPWPLTLATGTIYSADRITVPANAGVKTGDRVILKGHRITVPNGFHWPVGAILKLQSVQQ